MRDDRDRLQDILDAIKNIERYAKRGRRVFEEDELVHTWMIHHIQIIGEAASKLTATFRKAHSQVHWAQIITMAACPGSGLSRHRSGRSLGRRGA